MGILYFHKTLSLIGALKSEIYNWTGEKKTLETHKNTQRLKLILLHNIGLGRVKNQSSLKLSLSFTNCGRDILKRHQIFCECSFMSIFVLPARHFDWR